MQALITNRGIAFQVDNFKQVHGNEVYLKLQKKFTIRVVDRITKIPKITKLYTIIKTPDDIIIEFPRHCSAELSSYVNKFKILLPLHEELEHIEYTGTSNPNQCVIIDYLLNEVFAGQEYKGATLNVMAGVGKTYIAMDIIGRMKLKTLIVVPNTYLLDQWVNTLKEYFPNVSIGLLYGKKKIDGDIIVGIINTVAECKEFIVKKQEYLVDDILKTVGLTIFDESHMYVSPEFRKVFKRVYSRYTIGLSATPNIREDKLDIIHQKWVGPIINADELDGYKKSLESFDSTAIITKYFALAENCKFRTREDGMIEYCSIIESMINDPVRNNLIIQNILELATENRNIFVFSDRRTHLETLFEILSNQILDSNRELDLDLPESNKKIILYGGSKEDTINQAKNISKIIFTTYAYSSTGVSITRMDTLVLCTPRRTNMKQIINRVFRMGSDQTIKRVIFDIADMKFPIKRQIKERILAYKERGSSIEYLEYIAK